MSETVYIRPIGFAPGPQSEEGDAVRLAGGLVYASRFAVIYRRDGEVVERWRQPRGPPETAATEVARFICTVWGVSLSGFPPRLCRHHHRRQRVEVGLIRRLPVKG